MRSSFRYKGWLVPPKPPLELYAPPDNTRRCFDVVSTSFDRYGRQMDVETTLCAYWACAKY